MQVVYILSVFSYFSCTSLVVAAIVTAITALFLSRVFKRTVKDVNLKDCDVVEKESVHDEWQDKNSIIVQKKTATSEKISQQKQIMLIKKIDGMTEEYNLVNDENSLQQKEASDRCIGSAKVDDPWVWAHLEKKVEAFSSQKNAPHSPKKVTKVIKVEKKKVLETSEVNSSKVTPQNICIGGKVDDPFAFQKLKAKIEMDIKWTPI